MSGHSNRFKAPSILLVVSVVSILLGFGLCGAFSGGSGSSGGNASAGIIFFLSGVLAFFVAVVWLLVALAQGSTQS